MIGAGMQVSAVLVVLTALSTVVSAAVGAWAFHRREHVPTARYFAALLAAQTAWTGAHLGEALAQSFDGKLFWDSIQSLPFAFMPPAYLLLAARFAGLRPPRAAIAGLAAIGGACALALATEPLHGRTRPDAHLIGSPPVLTYELGAWDLILGSLALGTVAVASVIVMRRTSQEHRLYAAQSATVAVAFAIPPLGTLLALGLDVHIDGDRDVTPLAFTLGAVVAAWGLIRHRLFHLAPIARDAVMARLPNPVVVVDHRRCIVDVNPAALELLGQTEAAIIGQLASEVLTHFPSLPPLVEGIGGEAELCHAGPRGVRWYEAIGSPLTDPDGHEVGALLILRDITVRKQASEQVERQLAFSETRFRALFDHGIQLTTVLDCDGRVVAANRAALELVGMREDELIGMPFWDTPGWTAAGPREQIRDAVTRAAAGERVRLQTQHVDPRGRQRMIDFALIPVRDADGRIIELITDGRDVTVVGERHRANTPVAVPTADPTITVMQDPGEPNRAR